MFTTLEDNQPVHPPSYPDRRRQFDVLRVMDMLFQAKHGCSQAEREVGATFRCDVHLFTDFRPVAKSDRLETTIDVTEIYDHVQKIMSGPTRNLIETVAEEIADTLFDTFHIAAVRVRLHKDRAPMAGVTGGFEVEIIRPWQGE